MTIENTNDKDVKKSDDTEKVIQKDYKDEISLLTTISKQNSEGIEALTKGVNDLKEEIKKNSYGTVAGSGSSGAANPVGPGTQKEEKPAVSDNDDAGGKVKDDPSYAPDGDAQGSIKAPADKAPATDTVDVSKSDVKKDGDEKKEADEKKEDKKETEDKKEDMQKSSDDYVYRVVKAVRPKVSLLPETPQGAPTGYQMLKAIDDGFGGKHTNYEQSFTEAYTRLLKGEFGSGLGGGNI